MLMLSGCGMRTCRDAAPVNFHLVDAGIYRSGQIDSQRQMDTVFATGIRTVLSLEQSPITIAERDWAHADGMAFHHIGMSGLAKPHIEDVRAALAYVVANQPILVHCLHGSDRTGPAS